MGRRKLAVVSDELEPEYRPLTPQQQEFVTLLAAGYSIKDAANEIGLSRRAVTYWLHIEDSSVRLEYERLRREAKKALSERVTKIYDLAFKAIEDMLSEEAPPAVRFQVVKMLFESRIQPALPDLLPTSGPQLVEAETNLAHQKQFFEQFHGKDMALIPS